MDKSRAQFEEWFNRVVFNLKLATSNDVNLVNCYWDAWHASRAAIEIEFPGTDEADTKSEMLDCCIQAVEDTGLKVKK